jgi:MtN3 and saliva related transmembrane protein
VYRPRATPANRHKGSAESALNGSHAGSAHRRHWLCWLPQALKIMRDRETRALSLPATATFTVGIGLWLTYGLAIGDWPLIVSNAVTLALMAAILAAKLRYG